MCPSELSALLLRLLVMQTRLLLANSGLEKQLKERQPVLVEEEDESSWGGWPWRRRASVQSSPSKTADSSPDT